MKLSDPCIFSEGTSQPSRVRNTIQNSPLHLGEHFKQRNHQQKPQNCEKHGIPVYSIKAEIRRQSKLCPTLGNVCIDGSNFLTLCACLPKQYLMDFSVTNPFWRVGEFAKIGILKKHEDLQYMLTFLSALRSVCDTDTLCLTLV